jgi:hypothetical protein
MRRHALLAFLSAALLILSGCERRVTTRIVISKESASWRVSAGAVIAILVVAIPVTGLFIMRFRKRWLAKINIAFTNRITSLFAGWLRVSAS